LGCCSKGKSVELADDTLLSEDVAVDVEDGKDEDVAKEISEVKAGKHKI
jgi:hypothetical protein